MYVNTDDDQRSEMITLLPFVDHYV